MSSTLRNAPEAIHWHRTATAAPDCQPMAGDITADVVIVGAGLTGLRTAIGLAEAGTDVVVLDAQQIGFGASGRSGGQCNPIWRATPDDLVKRFGKAQAETLIQTTLSSADDLFDDIRRYEVDCGAEQNGWLQCAHCETAAISMAGLGDAWRAAGADIQELDAAQTRSATGSPAYDFALRHAKGGFVHPLSLTRGYARAAVKHGARLFENSPVTQTKREGTKWRVQTPGGAVIADQVVLTTNAYTDGIWPGLRQSILPMVSIAFATEPLSPEQQAGVLPGRLTISDSRRAIYFARYDADNRLIFGCIGSQDGSNDMFGGRNRLQEALGIVFPQIANIGIECAWAGRIAVTPEMMPHLHEPKPGVLAGLGFSGRGIAMTSVMGRTLARKILGGANQDLAFPVTRIKPMPMHWAAQRLVPLLAPSLSIRDKIDGFVEKISPRK